MRNTEKNRTCHNCEKNKRLCALFLTGEDMQATRWVPAHHCVSCGVEGSDGKHRVKVLTVHKGVKEPATFMEDLHPPRPHHAPHHKAVVLFGVPHCRELRQPAAGLHVMSVGSGEKGVTIFTLSNVNLQNNRSNGWIYLIDLTKGELGVIAEVSYILVDKKRFTSRNTTE